MSLLKRLPTPQIVDIYFSTKARLQSEQAKGERDLATANNIDAYAHILRQLEEQYDLAGTGQRAA